MFNMSHNLLAEFESLSTQEWKQKIEKYLRGKSYDSIVCKVDEDIEIQPFYRVENSFTELPVLSDNQWLISESFHWGSAADTNKAILNALENAVNSINLLADSAKTEDLIAMLDSVYLNMIDLNICGDAPEQNPSEWIEAISKLKDIQNCRGSFSFSRNNEKLHAELSGFPVALKNWTLFNISIDLSAKSISQSFSEGLKETTACFDMLLKHGFDADQAQSKIKYTFQTGDDYFLNIAAVRAFKRLWLGILEGYEVKNAIYPKIHAVTNPTLNDPYLNMISNTSQALSVAIAQVSSIEVSPSDSNATDFSRRIARNVQNLLKLESHIDQVSDASSGSYYIENYSAAISKKTWKLFTS